MLTEVCDFVHNYFVAYTTYGVYTISDGIVESLYEHVTNGQRFRIVGSALNDGIYTYLDGNVYNDDATEILTLAEETFTGAISAMAVPQSFLGLVQEIAAWVDKNRAVLDSPYTSESYAGYTYSKAAGSGANAGGLLSWQDVFRGKLKAYRKIA